jgi:hypothetical protein
MTVKVKDSERWGKERIWVSSEFVVSSSHDSDVVLRAMVTNRNHV